jgi:hypothetical protein
MFSVLLLATTLEFLRDVGLGMRDRQMFADAGAKRPPNRTGLCSLWGKSLFFSISWTSFVVGKLDSPANRSKAHVNAAVNELSPELSVRCSDSQAPRN